MESLTLGHDFSKLLMIRQAIARAVLKSCKNDIAGWREDCVRELVDLLSQLLPKSKVKDISTNVIKFLDTAIQLKNEMTEEQAVYRCYMLAYGELVTNAQLNIGDEEGLKGAMFLCTFPGLQRFVLNEEGEMEVLTVVKANGTLQEKRSTAEVNEVNNEAESPPNNNTVEEPVPGQIEK